jgi:hypothetical protein
VETPVADKEYTSIERVYEVYKEIKRLATVLTNIGGFLKEKHPELLLPWRK